MRREGQRFSPNKKQYAEKGQIAKDHEEAFNDDYRKEHSMIKMRSHGRKIAWILLVVSASVFVLDVILPELELLRMRRTSTSTHTLEHVVTYQVKKNVSKIPPPVQNTSTTITTTSTPQQRKRHEPYYRAASPILRHGRNHTFGGVRARAYDRRWVPCLEPEPTWKSFHTQNTPTREGFLFLKTFKSGSSTASGVDLRIARNVARRRQTGFDVCKTRYDHAWASVLYPVLDRGRKAFLWTIVRDPTTRAVSQLFHFHVSRQGNPTTDDSLIQKIRTTGIMFNNYYLGSLSRQKPQPDRDPVAVANQIIRQYDFIAVTERMDESVVALSMLLGLPLGDVLYLKAKGNGGYDDAGGEGHVCTYIQPAFVSQGMESYFRSDEYQEMVEWDYLLYLAANRSLDLTIDALGRDVFETKLAQFHAAQGRAVEKCQSITRFPCSTTGKRNKETDCLWNDSGCGYRCLDEVATELGLWKK